MRNLAYFISLICSLTSLSAHAQKDTSFVIGDTIFTYSYYTHGSLRSVMKYLRGRDYETYNNSLYLNEKGDTSSFYFEDQFKHKAYSVLKNRRGIKTVSYKANEDTVVYKTFDKRGQQVETSMILVKKNQRIVSKYKNERLTSIDSSAWRKDKPVKVYRLKAVDTIYIQYPELVFNGNGYVDEQGKKIRDVCYFMDSIILKATKNAPRLYYMKGSKPVYMTQNSRSGLYRKGHIPYQGFWRFRHIDTILHAYPHFYLNPDHISMFGNRKFDSVQVEAFRDSLLNERIKFAGRRYYLKEYSFNTAVYREGIYRRGNKPAGIYIENHRCNYMIKEKHYRYKTKGYYDRKGRKDGVWKEYQHCTGLFHYKEYYKKGKLIWREDQYLQEQEHLN